uniref:hypothetical protein n=1 Tax=Polaromonas sp. TaxID=1869339 RepID=UPI00159B4E8C|nr:hypothetical protein [Polaromonas sp.]QJS06522.1 hypothetical protein [Polaromonas sp.]
MKNPKTLAEMDEQLAQLKVRREKLAAKLAGDAKKLDTQKKIILGGWLMQNRADLAEGIPAKLTRAQDRKAFGLEPLPTEPAAAEKPAKA